MRGDYSPRAAELFCIFTRLKRAAFLLFYEIKTLEIYCGNLDDRRHHCRFFDTAARDSYFGRVGA